MCAAGFFAQRIHIEKQETSFSWKHAKRFVEAKGARLLTLPEVHGYLQEGTELIKKVLVGPTGESRFPHTVPYQSILGPQLLPFKVYVYACVLVSVCVRAHTHILNVVYTRTGTRRISLHQVPARTERCPDIR